MTDEVQLTEVQGAILEALAEKPEGGQILSHEQIQEHPRLSTFTPPEIDEAVADLEIRGSVEVRNETGSPTPYAFDSISLTP